MTKLSEIEGIGEAYASQLESSGVTTQEDLLKKGAEASDRKALAETSGLSEKQILSWVNRADLARIKGVGSEYADLLEWAGVDTVPELATRNPSNLFEAITKVNEEKKLVRALPSESQLTEWVAQAKTLPRAVNH